MNGLLTLLSLTALTGLGVLLCVALWLRYEMESDDE